MTKNDLEIQLEALQSLLHHPGWQIISERMRMNAAAQMAAMCNAPDQDTLLKHAYTFMAVQDLLEVPNLLMKPLVQQLQALNTQPRKQ